MALTGWGDPKLKITIPAQSEALTDFPVLVNLTTASGTGDFDCSDVFDTLGSNSKKLAIEYGDTGEQCFVEVERWDAANKSAQLWVKVPTVSASAATELNLYYDAAHADNTAAADPYWTETVLALPMDGAEGSTTFTDLKGKTVTRYGDAKITAAQSVFGGGAAYFDGTGDYLSTPDSTDFALGSDNFTIEVYAYLSSLPSSGQRTIIAQDDIMTTRGWLLICDKDTSNKILLAVRSGGTAYTIKSISAASTGVWQHVAVVRNGTSLALYIDGALQESTNVSTAAFNDVAYNLTIGAYLASGSPGASSYWHGYVDDLRITKGVARYTADFTPPTRSVFEAAQGYVGGIGDYAARQVWDANYAAVYHLSQDPAATVKDSTVNAYNLTPYGTMTSNDIIDGITGKAIDFDGIDDRLVTTTAYDFNSGDITVEANIYFTNSTESIFFDNRKATDKNRFFMGVNGGTVGAFRMFGNDGTSRNIYSSTGQGSAWHNIACVKSGTTGTMYVDGILDGTGTIGADLSNGGSWTIGSVVGGSFPTTMRLSKLRVSKVARSAAWLAASYNSDFDQLVALSAISSDLTELEMTGTIPLVLGVESPFESLAGAQTLEVVGNIGHTLEPGAVVRVVYYDRNRVLRDGLMVMHDTTYGTLVDASAWGLIPGASGSSFVADVPADFYISGPIENYIPVTLNAPLTVNTPIDFISWQQVGNAAVDLTAPWRNCLVLYSRL